MSCSVQDDVTTAVKFSLLIFFPIVQSNRTILFGNRKLWSSWYVCQIIVMRVVRFHQCDAVNIVEEPLITDQTSLTATLISILVDSALKS